MEGMLAAESLVGRSGPLHALQQALDATRSGEGMLVPVAGEAGAGKSALLLSFAAAARSGAVLRWAGCVEDDAAPVFWPIVQLLRDPADVSLQEVVATLSGETSAELRPEDRFRMFDAVATALRRAACRKPQVLVVDDAHWADASTLRLLRFLAGQARTAPILLVVAYRDTELPPAGPLAELVTDAAAVGATVVLPGLDLPAVHQLVQRVAGAPPPPRLVQRIRDHTGGNPLFVTQVARLLAAEGRLTGAGSLMELPLPPQVRGVLERRLARLSQPAHVALRRAAALGMAFSTGLLAEVADAPVAEVTALLDEAVRARLAVPLDPTGTLDTAGADHAFAHPLIRSTAYAQLGAAERTAVHARAADALAERHGGDGQRLAERAYHELRAGPQRSATGIALATRAARRALRLLAFEEAAASFARAADAAAAASAVATEAELRLALGDALLRSGDWDAAGRSFLTAARLGRDLDRPDLLARAALGFGADASGFEVRLMDHAQLRLLDEALQRVGDTDPLLRSWLLARRSVASTFLEPVEERRVHSEEAVALARACGDAAALTYALSSWCDAYAGPAWSTQRLAAARQMLALSEGSGNREAQLLARRLVIVALLEVGDRSADRDIDAFATLAERLGQPLHRWYVPLFRGMQALRDGRLTEAEGYSAEAAALGAQAGSSNAAMLAGTQVGAIRVQRGELPAVAAEIERSFREHPEWRDFPTYPVFRVLASALAGDLPRARRELDRLADDGFATIPDDSERLSALQAVVSATVHIRYAPAARALYDALAPYAGRVVVDGIAAACLDPVDTLLGHVAWIAGRPAVARAHYEAGAETARRLGAPLLQAAAQHALAGLLEETGQDPGTARRLRRSAEEVLAEAGAGKPLSPATVSRPSRPADQPPPATPTPDPVFTREGATWCLTFAGRTVNLPDAKGMRDLRALLGRPGHEIKATQLLAGGDSDAVPRPSSGAAMLDAPAKAAYRARLLELDEELAEAQAFADPVRAERAAAERDALVDQLTAAVGLAGRDRRMGDDAERARKAVTMRIRNAVARIRREHPELARHLQRSVRTGSACVYDPEEPVSWRV